MDWKEKKKLHQYIPPSLIYITIQHQQKPTVYTKSDHI